MKKKSIVKRRYVKWMLLERNKRNVNNFEYFVFKKTQFSTSAQVERNENHTFQKITMFYWDEFVSVSKIHTWHKYESAKYIFVFQRTTFELGGIFLTFGGTEIQCWALSCVLARGFTRRKKKYVGRQLFETMQTPVLNDVIPTCRFKRYC